MMIDKVIVAIEGVLVTKFKHKLLCNTFVGESGWNRLRFRANQLVHIAVKLH